MAATQVSSGNLRRPAKGTLAEAADAFNVQARKYVIVKRAFVSAASAHVFCCSANDTSTFSGLWSRTNSPDSKSLLWETLYLTGSDFVDVSWIALEETGDQWPGLEETTVALAKSATGVVWCGACHVATGF